MSHPQVRWKVRQVEDKAYLFAHFPAKRLSERSAQPPVDVTFTLDDGRTVTMKLAPDSADWVWFGGSSGKRSG